MPEIGQARSFSGCLPVEAGIVVDPLGVDFFAARLDAKIGALAVFGIKAAGVGLNPTAATYVFFVSRPWTPADQTQAEDRAYRIGQNLLVEVYIPIVPDTIDEQIRALLLNKKKITDDVLIGALEAEQRRSEDLASRAQCFANV
jgi:hypothetical protein